MSSVTDKERKNTLRMIRAGLKAFPKVLALKKRAFEEKKKHLKAYAPVSRALSKKTDLANTSRSMHPWRLCPLGMFYRKSHSQQSYVRDDGTPVRSSVHPPECVVNRTGKDQIYAEELQEIALRHFGSLAGAPAANDLTYPDGNKYDSLIRGWTRYWNEVLQPEDPLDPNLVKALIATESSFDADPPLAGKDKLKVRGLMQVTNESRRWLSGEGTELKDHFVHVDLDDMTDPNLNIACGIRWLFRKKEIVDSRKKESTWVDAVMAYKSYESMKHEQMIKFLDRYETLKNSK